MNRIKCVLLFALSLIILNTKALAANEEIHNPEEFITGTLPVLYINTDSMAPIDSKEVYVQATYYLDAMGVEGVKSIGSAELPDTLQIRGRGNSSWLYPKKPYRIKLNKKTAVLGMPKSKHFVLMADYLAYRAYLLNESGFELSRRLKLGFTPMQVPVEMVLNGDYVGVYFVTQNIRIDKDRVNIVEQEENDTVPENITGGWLIEKDNMWDDNPQFAISRDIHKIITVHNPEVMSDVQYSYIKNYIYKCDDLINITDKTSREWEDYIDIDSLARYYIIQEILENVESFSGSCWMHKDRGDSTKLIFGPVWDLGNQFGHVGGDKNQWLYEDVPDYCHNLWIEEVCKFPHFQQVVRKIWTQEVDDIRDGLGDYLLAWANKLRKAGVADHKRWPASLGHDIYYQSNRQVQLVTNRIKWLDRVWNMANLYDVNNDGDVDVNDINTFVNLFMGKLVDSRIWADMDFDGSVDVSDLNKVLNDVLRREPPVVEE